MKTVRVFENESIGKVKPMHAVNNGPVYKFGNNQRITNIDAFRDAGIPYARNHDASLFSQYGGEHIVDVHAIFPNFDADPYDESSYDFVCTDEYLRVIDFAEVKTFYRLGSKIEHSIKKYGTLPPKDFKKWAIICEHIIKHYNYGWANGFHYNIEYWEIWNEPDLNKDTDTNKSTWGGTAAQFYDLYNVAAVHLKATFPELKIGGPAIAMSYNSEWLQGFFNNIKLKPDFFSWHAYARDVDWVVTLIRRMRGILDDLGYTDVECILNEWNYVDGWEADKWLYSLKSIKGLKGAAFTAGVMCVGQNEPIDMLMYYDARPGAMNGMFCTDWVCENLKGYYPFRMFNELYKKDYAVRVDRSEAEKIYLTAAKNSDTTSIMLTYFDNDEKEAFSEVEICLEATVGKRTAEIYLLDENHDMELVETKEVENKITLNMSLFSTVLINLK